MAGTSGRNSGNVPSSSYQQVKEPWRSTVCSTSSSAVVSPSTSCTSSLTNNFNDDINEVLGQMEPVPFYKLPDQYDGLVDKIRESLREQEPELELSRQLLHKLKTKAQQLLPNMPSTSQSMSSIMSMLDTPCYYLPSSSNSDGASCYSIDPSVQSVLDSLEPMELPAKSLKDTTCEMCHETFASVQSKYRHAKRKHADQLDQVVTKYAPSCLPFACPTCDKSFSNASVLRRHERRHQEDQLRFSCEQCSKKYILGSELRKHIKQLFHF
uniref:C2H2-type domain-containing protein n=1 Tax=Ditylenchus dipsaci TaxID=166011 RepID=A0A915DWF2_9BILA